MSKHQVHDPRTRGQIKAYGRSQARLAYENATQRALPARKPGLSPPVIHWAIAAIILGVVLAIASWLLGPAAAALGLLCFTFGVFSCGSIIAEAGRKDDLYRG